MKAKPAGSPRKRPLKKHAMPRIEVHDPNGKLLYKGKERRKHRELVFFDSKEGIRRFAFNPNLIRPSRLRALRKMDSQKKVLGITTFPSQRRTKYKIKKL